MRHCCIICLWKGKIVSLLYELSLERKKKFCCCMICFWKEKTFSLLYDLSWKSKNIFVAVWFVLNSTKFYTLPHTLQLAQRIMVACTYKKSNCLKVEETAAAKDQLILQNCFGKSWPKAKEIRHYSSREYKLKLPCTQLTFTKSDWVDTNIKC